MTLEAAKEMDRRCVLNWLNEVYVTPSRAFNEYTEDELKMFAHDAIVLLNEQETADTGSCRIFQCKKCGFGIDDIFVNDEGKYQIVPRYCPNCGRPVKRV